MASELSRITAAARKQAVDAVRELTSLLSDAGLVLPSLAVDWHEGRFTGDVLVDLGRARADVVMELVGLLREGLDARGRQSS
ncbi:hypothetical protein [Kitasatospora mediocidica]|uniref:hypothetical protein n=1 Tax=Kitasatospora mediocidica TaxID=58352 RepID=UPI00056393D9|nr:hypothetical protein [Kitasatospora mediocidica]